MVVSDVFLVTLWFTAACGKSKVTSQQPEVLFYFLINTIHISHDSGFM